MINKNVGKVSIGKNLKLESGTNVRVLDDGILKIGKNCFINCNSYITVMGKTVIGEDCIIDPNVLIFDHDHDYKSSEKVKYSTINKGEIIVGNNVWIWGMYTIKRYSYWR